ncbi:MAG: hypothetical protein ACT4NX_05235 [Deltaproteobacteria bacterium]
MEILSPKEIVRREWENVSLSLNKCGNAGKFEKFSPIKSDEALYCNAQIMENKIPVSGYLTPEAFSLFGALALAAGANLGLADHAARAFASAYGWVRTGMLINPMQVIAAGSDGGETLSMQTMFFNSFYEGNINYEWDFDCPECAARLGIIFQRFRMWPRGEISQSVRLLTENQHRASIASAELTL